MGFSFTVIKKIIYGNKREKKTTKEEKFSKQMFCLYLFPEFETHDENSRNFFFLQKKENRKHIFFSKAQGFELPKNIYWIPLYI